MADEHSSSASLPVLVRMRSVSIEIYQDPRVDERDDVIVIDLTQPTSDKIQGCIPDAARGETAAKTERGMISYRAGRTARATGGMVNLYI